MFESLALMPLRISILMYVYSGDDRRLCRSSSTFRMSSIVRLPDTTPSWSPPGLHPRSSPVYWFLRKYNFVNFEEALAVTVVTNMRPA